MASVNECWGIELGASAIKALKLGLKPDGSVEVLDFALIPHKKVLSTPDLDADDAMRVAIGQLVSQYDLESAPIAISVPGHQAFARFAKLPPVEPKKVAGLVQYEAVQQIPFPLDEVEWDFQTFMSPDSPEVEVGIFAITKQRIERELSLFRDVGLSPDAINIAPVSAYNAMAYDLQFTEKTPGTVIMDVGTTSTDLIIADAGRVWMRTFPIGGHHFTEALVDKFKLTYAKAERLKREAERSKHSRHVFQAMKGVFADLAQETQRSIGYHNSLHPDANLSRVVGIGSTFRLPGLRRFLKQQLQLDVYRMDDFKRLTLDGPRAGEFGALALEMSVAYGLALQGLGMPTIDANLMPVGIVREGMWGRKVKWFGMAAGLSVAASAAMFINWAIDNAAVSNNRKPVSIQNVVNQANSLKSEATEAGVIGQAEADTVAQSLIQLPEGRELMSYVVKDLGEIVAWSNNQVPTWQGAHGNGPAHAFDVMSYTMTYTNPASGEEGGDFGGGGRAPRFGGGEDPYPDKPKIDVVLEVETLQPDARPFMLGTVLPWLQASAEREGVPYVIIDTEQLNYQQVAAGARNNGDRRMPQGGRETSTYSEFSEGGDIGGDIGGGGGHGRPAPGGREFDERGGDRNTGSRQVQFTAGSLDQMAPLPIPEQPAFDRDPSRFVIRWTLAVVPPDERKSDDQSATDDGGIE
ncbi:MAG: type IV pilus assembly protein PilM [Phycisphaerales bacterium]|nr:type IV pilus assembly protein PilM [Phycisphaerales bacterium]MCB9837606.1 type IV pilus assembly protein PilM [Phycisphaera sp.]